MYLINWESQNQLIEANLGGVITAGEMDVMVEELIDLFIGENVTGFEFVLDTTFVKRFEDGTQEQMNRLRDLLAVNGTTFVYVAGDAQLAESLISQNLQSVLEGREVYRVAA